MTTEMTHALGWTHALRREIGKAVVGQDRLVDRLLVALLTGGHVLLEGLPGLAKTLVVRSLAQACVCSFNQSPKIPSLEGCPTGRGGFTISNTTT